MTSLEKNEYGIIRAQYASLEVTEQVIALDAMAFDTCYRVTADDDHALFSVNREGGFIVIDKKTGEVIGYSMLLPLTSVAYDMIRRGRFVDSHLHHDMVMRYDRPGIYDLYFASIVINPKFRGLRLALKLMDVMVQDFINLTDRGIYIRRMMADVVSNVGEKFCRLFGLDEVCETDHNSKIYEVTGLPPKMRVTTEITKRLYEVYNEKFKMLERS